MGLPPFLKSLENTDPKFAELIKKVFVTALEPGALDQKTKLLIALAVDAASGCADGVASVARQARIVGATDEEIAEALRIAYLAPGNDILAVFSAAYK